MFPLPFHRLGAVIKHSDWAKLVKKTCMVALLLKEYPKREAVRLAEAIGAFNCLL